MAISASQKRSKKQNRILLTTVNGNTVEEASDDNMLNNNNLTYTASSGAVLRRIRTPSPHDVLSGRGGNVNAHPGNHQFREWVKVRREDYSLAFSKEAKAVICREVIALVEKLGGRFLTKESPASSWWVELDEERIMAKTSQALREGAPQIRASHQEEVAEMMQARQQQRLSSRKSKKRQLHPEPTISINATAPSITPEKRARFESDDSDVMILPNVVSDTNVNDNTDTIVTAPKTDYELMPAPEAVPSTFFQSQSPSSSRLFHRPNKTTLTRQNSLALSDLGDMSMDIEFVNPFADESELLGRQDGPSSSLAHNTGMSSPNVGAMMTLPPPQIPKPGSLWRRESSTASDMGGLGVLFRSTDSAKSNGSLSSLGPFFRESSMSSLMGNGGSINNLSLEAATTAPPLSANSLNNMRNISNGSSRSRSSIVSDLSELQGEAARPFSSASVPAMDFADGMKLIQTLKRQRPRNDSPSF